MKNFFIKLYKSSTLYKNRKAKAKAKAMKDIGRWVDPDTGIVYFDSSRWCSPTKMRSFC